MEGVAICARAEAACADFLQQMHKKPKELIYVGCKQLRRIQGEPLEASYRVKGSAAADVEQVLIRNFGVKKLQRNCCLWETTQNAYRDDRMGNFVISMATGETLVSSASGWARIPYFYVKVDRYEDP